MKAENSFYDWVTLFEDENPDLDLSSVTEIHSEFAGSVILNTITLNG